ncbi:MAG TPA: glutathione binding-like protein [Gammaproteobacteria bacterium]|nr:glutathione binding-like protein [Gammaproteobacteria bacterium]
MIDLYYWPTPNGQKIRVFMEESGMPHRAHKVDIGKGEQFKPEFLAISPNNRIPAIVDDDPEGGGGPLSVFESGAVLWYLGEKTGKFLPKELRGRMEVMQWLFWQNAGLGPMAGQKGHFSYYAPEEIPYAVDRYTREVGRLFGVLNKRLADREYVAGKYSIADMSCYTWVVPWKGLGQDLADFPHLKRWFESIKARPAVQRAYEGVEEPYTKKRTFTDEERKTLFGQTHKDR